MSILSGGAEIPANIKFWFVECADRIVFKSDQKSGRYLSEGDGDDTIRISCNLAPLHMRLTMMGMKNYIYAFQATSHNAALGLFLKMPHLSLVYLIEDWYRILHAKLHQLIVAKWRIYASLNWVIIDSDIGFSPSWLQSII